MAEHNDLEIEELTKNVEARTRLGYIEKAVTDLSNGLTSHMEKEEIEKKKIERKLMLIAVVCVLNMVGIAIGPDHAVAILKIVTGLF